MLPIKCKIYKASLRGDEPSIANSLNKVIDFIVSGNGSYCYLLSFDDLTGFDCELITRMSKPHNDSMVMSFFEARYISDDKRHAKIRRKIRKKQNEVYAKNLDVSVVI